MKTLYFASFLVALNICTAHGDEHTVDIKAGNPGFYVPLDTSRASSEMTLLNSEQHGQSVVTTTSIAASLVSSHGTKAIMQQTPTKNPSGLLLPIVENPASLAAPRNLRRTIPLNSCQDITAPGHYVVRADLNSDSPCLTIRNSQNIQIDCAGHSLSSKANAVLVQNVNQFSLSDCRLGGENLNSNLVLIHVSDFKLEGNDIQRLSVNNSQRGVVNDNHITGVYLQTMSSYVSLIHNRLDRIDLYGIAFIQGNHNQALQNHIDGVGSGINTLTSGADDGIILQDEKEDVIKGNTIMNTYDAGIEGTGRVQNTLIADNLISNVGYAGIGSYHGTSWMGNTVRNNVVTGSNQLFEFDFSDNGTNYLQDPVSGPVFKDNVIENNRLRSRNPVSQEWPTASFSFPGATPSNVSNNLIRNNDYGINAPPPLLEPASGFIDGGGNRSGPSYSLPIRNRGIVIP